MPSSRRSIALIAVLLLLAGTGLARWWGETPADPLTTTGSRTSQGQDVPPVEPQPDDPGEDEHGAGVPPPAVEPEPDAGSPSAAEVAAAVSPAQAGDVGELGAPSAILMDAGTGRVLFEKNAAERRPIASLTKLMTLLLAMEALESGRIRWDDQVVASDLAAQWAVGTHIFLHRGEQITVGNLMYAVAVGSANDASIALAEHIAGSVEEFVRRMNERAGALGMTDTQYRNPHGFDEDGHYSSARDQAILARELVKYPKLLEMTAIFHLPDTPEPRVVGGRRVQVELLNRNRLVLWYPGADGLKTGWTSRAAYCVAATAHRGDTRMIAVILGHPDGKARLAEAARLMTYGFANWVSVPIVRRGDVVGHVRVRRGGTPTVAAVAADDLLALIRRGQEEDVERRVELRSEVPAPLAKGDPVGRVVAGLEGETAGSVDLVAAEAVPKLGYFGLVWRLLDALWRVPQ